jgi:hypothetical protein
VNHPNVNKLMMLIRSLIPQQAAGNALAMHLQTEGEMTIREGMAAPAFSLPDSNGNRVALTDFRGKNVILYFYPKDNTSG